MGWVAWHSHCVGLQATERQKAQRPKAQLSPPHLPRKSSLSGSSSYRSTSRSCPGTSYTMNWKEREVTLKHDLGEPDSRSTPTSWETWAESCPCQCLENSPGRRQ